MVKNLTLELYLLQFVQCLIKKDYLLKGKFLFYFKYNRKILTLTSMIVSSEPFWLP